MEMTTLVLVVVLLVLACAAQTIRFKRRETIESKVLKGYFLMGLSGLIAKIAAADGRVTNDETDLAVKFFNNMNLTDAERSMCIGHFVTARRDGLSVRDHVARFQAYATPAACAYLYCLLWKLSRADGTVDAAEEQMLVDVAQYLGLGYEAHDKMKRGETPRFDQAELKAAGIPPALIGLI